MRKINYRKVTREYTGKTNEEKGYFNNFVDAIISMQSLTEKKLCLKVNRTPGLPSPSSVCLPQWQASESERRGVETNNMTLLGKPRREQTNILK